MRIAPPLTMCVLVSHRRGNPSLPLPLPLSTVTYLRIPLQRRLHRQTIWYQRKTLFRNLNSTSATYYDLSRSAFAPTDQLRIFTVFTTSSTILSHPCQHCNWIKHQWMSFPASNTPVHHGYLSQPMQRIPPYLISTQRFPWILYQVSGRINTRWVRLHFSHASMFQSTADSVPTQPFQIIWACCAGASKGHGADSILHCLRKTNCRWLLPLISRCPDELT